MNVKKLLATAGAVALVASGTVLGVASPAQAAPSITVSPNTNLKGGQIVTVTYTGFSPNAPVAVGVCPTERVKAGIKGPGDCGRTKNGAAKLTTADASGKGTAQITIVEGALGNATPPAAKCPACSMGATNIANAAENAAVALKYGDSENEAVAPKPGPDPGKKLPPTGAREAVITGIAAFVVLQIGLVLFVRASRSAPRRTAA